MKNKFLKEMVNSFYLLFGIICFHPSYAEESVFSKEVKHIVVVMFENRSFDNFLGWLYSDLESKPLNFFPKELSHDFMGLYENTLNQYVNHLYDISGDLIFSCPPIKGIPSINTRSFLNSPETDPYEPFKHVTYQIFCGETFPSMKGFLQDFAHKWWSPLWEKNHNQICAVMETYTEKELPYMYGLAKHYAVSDEWFASVPTQTNPNRAFMAAGTSLGKKNNSFLSYDTFYTDTIWNRLESQDFKGTWSVFWEEHYLPFSFYHGPFTRLAFPHLNYIPNVDKNFKLIDEFHVLARSGKLPEFSFIEPAWTMELASFGIQGNDHHPPGGVKPGENLLANIYTSLISNKEAWKHTVLIVVFDEHGGLFDHIIPPKSIPPDDYDQEGFKFDRYGVRVPALVISPLVQKSTVFRSSNPETPFDHTSIPATILEWKNSDRSKWNLGKRVERAPTINSVINLPIPRSDWIVIPKDIQLRPTQTQEIVHFDEPFCLKNRDGKYLTHFYSGLEYYPRLGKAKDKIILQFSNGKGDLTHGSYAHIHSTERELGINNELGAFFCNHYCYYYKNKNDSRQAWTVKSLSSPYLAAPIHYGDPIHLENIYNLDIKNWHVQCLIEDSSSTGFLTTTNIENPLAEEAYWIIEKPWE